jgi:hypothetical protein
MTLQTFLSCTKCHKPLMEVTTFTDGILLAAVARCATCGSERIRFLNGFNPADYELGPTDMEHEGAAP